MRSLSLAVVSIAALLVACSKSESSPSTPGSANATTSVPPVASSAPVAAAASAQPSASASASAEPAGSASAAPAAKAAAAGKDAGGGAAECGTKPLPDCPLQAWMKKNMNPPSLSGDGPALAAALEKAATFAPPGYTNWASISNDGAKAAKGGDVAAAKASCRSCHDQYKKKYQTEMRGRSI